MTRHDVVHGLMRELFNDFWTRRLEICIPAYVSTLPTTFTTTSILVNDHCDGKLKKPKNETGKKKKKRRYNFSDIFDQHIHVLRLFLLALGLADFWLLEGIWSSAGLSSRCSFVLVDSWVSVSFAWYLNDVFWACVGKIVLKGCIFVFFFLFSLLFLLCFGTQICSNPLLVMVMTYLYSSFTLYVYDDDLYIRKKEEKNKKRIDDFVIVFWNLVVWYLCVVRGQDAIIICLFSTNYE